MTRRATQLWAIAVVSLLSGRSFAQGDVTRFRTPITPLGLFSISETDPLPHLELTGGMMAHFASNPVVWRYNNGSFDHVIATQTFMDLFVAMGLFDLFDVGLVLPVLIQQEGPPRKGGLGDLRGAGVGDLRLLPRVQISNEAEWGVGASFISEFAFGSGDEERFTGNPGAITWRPTVVASFGLDPFMFLGRVGLQIRTDSEVAPGPETGPIPTLDLGDTLDFAGGAEIDLIKRGAVPTDILVEMAGSTSLTDVGNGDHVNLELMAGVRMLLVDWALITAGIAFGLTQGVGTPGYRALLGFAYAPVPPDWDNDGIPDSRDDCPDTPEDADGFEDDDGCPDRDNDEDGVPDTEDECPDDGEDFNDFQDEDGCPDGDDLDDDKDGIKNKDDKCPLQPEDFDDFEDDDGCPEDDNDQDGVPDDQDICPDDKETINGVEDYDGCPDEGEGATRVVETKIEIDETILFESGKAIIKERSKRILDQVALQVLAHPYIVKVRIEGHTDSLGEEEDNLYLSQDRADSVRRYLVGRGVDKKKLEAIGFGETRPLTSNDTATGRRKNRRVEFVIIQEAE